MYRESPVDPSNVAVDLVDLTRDEIKPKLLNFPSPTVLDFTEEFLDTLTTEELRHILLAAMLYLRSR
jgi:hypothetical protein